MTDVVERSQRFMVLVGPKHTQSFAPGSIQIQIARAIFPRLPHERNDRCAFEAGNERCIKRSHEAEVRHDIRLTDARILSGIENNEAVLHTPVFRKLHGVLFHFCGTAVSGIPSQCKNGFRSSQCGNQGSECVKT